MDTDVLLGHLWNKMGRFRKGIVHNRRFLSERHAQLQDLLARSAAGCSSGEFDARGLANIVHGAAKAGLLTFELGRGVHALCDAAGEGLTPIVESQFHPQMVANACWAFGAARHPCPRFFGAVSSALRGSSFRTESLGPQGLANVAWAFAKVGHADAACFGALEAACLSRLAELSPQQLSNLLWAYASLGHPAPALFDAVADAATGASASVDVAVNRAGAQTPGPAAPRCRRTRHSRARARGPRAGAGLQPAGDRQCGVGLPDRRTPARRAARHACGERDAAAARDVRGRAGLRPLVLLRRAAG